MGAGDLRVDQADVAPSPRSIRVLDGIVVDQIAAGEVVERPASVVKELVENALDAGARGVVVHLGNGGRSLIEVRDDGCGMAREDALLAVERFATSKLRSVDDLLTVDTHGFRGEALPSIAAVSRFSLQSSTEVGPGVELTIEGGRLVEVRDFAMQRGTAVTVRNLFYNVPARRAFLRSERTEEGFVRSLLFDFGAAYPHVDFRLLLDGREVWSIAVARTLDTRLRELHSEDGILLDGEQRSPEGISRLRGVVCRPQAAAAGSGRLRLIVNRRSVRDRLLLRAVRDGYRNFLHGDRYPTGVVILEVPPITVDVNVHPQKSEVRFRGGDRVFSLVCRSVANALQRAEIHPALSARSHALALSAGTADVSGDVSGEMTLPAFIEGFEGIAPSTAIQVAKAAPVAPLRFLGQLFRCYLLFEQGESCVVVDMHAAHERIRFCQLKREFRAGRIRSQLLVLPEVVALPPEGVARFADFRDRLEHLGFSCDLFGESQMIVRSIPAVLGNVSPLSLIADLLSLPDGALWDLDLERRCDAAIARLACHSSVRSGHELGREEAFALIDRLQEAEEAAFCPHGRPVLFLLSKGELESRFGRS